VETGVQHILADIMAKDINIITATRQWYVLFDSTALINSGM